jgi:hypothetical protein
MVHKSAVHVNARLQLLAEPDIAAAVRAGELPPTAARAVLRARKGRHRAAGDTGASRHAPDAPPTRTRHEAETAEAGHAKGEHRTADDRPHHERDDDLVDLARSRTACAVRIPGSRLITGYARQPPRKDLLCKVTAHIGPSIIFDARHRRATRSRETGLMTGGKEAPEHTGDN